MDLDDFESYAVMGLANPMTKLMDFLRELDARALAYELASFRDEAVTVKVALPGERWEVEFFPDGQVEAEVFRSAGIQGEEALERLLSRATA